MTTKEFKEKTLKQLIIDLKDVDNYKSFKNGSFIYDLGYYQGNLLINEIERLNNIINEAIAFVKNNKDKTIAPYGDNEDTDYEVCLFEDDINYLLNILNKGSDKE